MMGTYMKKRSYFCFVIIVFLAGFYTSAAACTVPVFRYALERWEPDVYPVIIYTKGVPQSKDSAIVQVIVKKYKANAVIVYADVTTRLAPELKRALQKNKPSSYPWVVVHGPAAVENRVVYSGAFDSAAIVQIFHSPARQEYVKRTIRGESAVLVCILSGDIAKDKKVNECILAALDEANRSIKLPLPQNGPVRHTNTIPFAINFSTMFIRRHEPSEQAFIQMVTSLKVVDLSDKGPIVSLMFGRGRNLDVLQGERITKDQIVSLCRFMAGSCSCTIKAQNPGVDILIDADWDGHVRGLGNVDGAQEPMTGMTSGGNPFIQ